MTARRSDQYGGISLEENLLFPLYEYALRFDQRREREREREIEMKTAFVSLTLQSPDDAADDLVRESQRDFTTLTDRQLNVRLFVCRLRFVTLLVRGEGPKI